MSLIRRLLIATAFAVLLPAGLLHAQDLGDTDPWPALEVERAAIAERLNVPTDIYEATAARQEADRSMANRDWNGAALAYERAIAADGPWAVGGGRNADLAPSRRGADGDRAICRSFGCGDSGTGAFELGKGPGARMGADRTQPRSPE
jgi:hypothetical protein